MKPLLCFFVMCSLFSALFASDIPAISAADAAKRVAGHQAVLVDVREPSEWSETGVAAPAVLLAKSDFDGTMTDNWKRFLAQNGDKEIILYCRSGKRAGAVAEALVKSGHKVANAGGFKDWQAAGLPVRQDKDPVK